MEVIPASVRLAVNGTQQLTVVTVPENLPDVAFTWTSDHSDIATVSDDGLVTALQTGSATINVSSGELQKSVSVLVSDQIIEVNPPSVILTVNGTQQLTATVVPDMPNVVLRWSSDDPAVAVVSDNGLVTARQMGVTTVRVTAGNMEETVKVSVGAIGQSEILSVQNGHLYLGGKKFAEISFNKFDLFWKLWDAAYAGEVINDAHPAVIRQDEALKELSQHGFKTIRTFCLPFWYKDFKAVYDDPTKRQNVYYAAIDKMLELCEKHQLKIVYCLGLTDFILKDWGLRDDGTYGMIYHEHVADLIGDPSSEQRQRVMTYLDDIIPRYRSSPAIAMWEIANETTLIPDIDPTHIYDGQRIPTMLQLSEFYRDVTARIKLLDPVRLVNNGGSILREYAYGLYHGTGWSKRDTYGQHQEIFDMLYADTGLGVVDIHYYAIAEGGYRILENDGVTPLWLDLKKYKAIADDMGFPIYVGEYAALPVNKSDTEFWTNYPDYFDTFDGDNADALRWVGKALNDAVNSGIPLIHWWCYQSDREQDQGDPQRMDLDLQRTPTLFQMVVNANHELKEKLGIINN
ncbi:MAG: Ig-like domain-containing protein [Bacteroidales bacterium]|jgi:hypothetical protein|nr:Ig-like domain-containing protein [Bacteroidales bacterium]